MKAMTRKTKALRYLGGMSGHGVVTHNGETLAQADFDFDGYFNAGGGVMVCGEIHAPPKVLKRLFGRSDLQLLTDRGLVLDLSFLDSTLAPGSDVAHVDVTGQLPTALADWRH
jgi:hypothetical protein